MTSCMKWGLIVLGSLLLLALVVAVLVVRWFNLSDRPRETQRRVITTAYGDRFLAVEMSIPEFPDPTAQIVLYLGPNKRQKKIILERGEESCFDEFAIIPLYRARDVKCYALNDPYIIWKHGRSAFEYCDDKKVRQLDVQRYAYLLPVARQQLQTGGWRWFDVFAEYLLRAGDPDAQQRVHRYARDQV